MPKNLSWVLIFSILCLLGLPVLWPSLRIHPLIPMIVLSYYKTSDTKALWFSFAAGLLNDLLTPEIRFGSTAIQYTLISGLLYPRKQQFFEDRLTTLPLMTFFFSFLSSWFGLLTEIHQMTFKAILTETFLFPLKDAAFGFTCFIVPTLFWGSRSRKGHEYFLSTGRI